MTAKAHLPAPIVAHRDPLVVLRPAATAEDVENLRRWKNANRHAFLHTTEITREQQAEWFRALCRREDDDMYMVECGGNTVGCMGLRRLGDAADVYNVIRGRHDRGSRGAMSLALRALAETAAGRLRLPVRARVLTGNPARSWYESNGFVVVQTLPDHVVLEWVPAGHVPPGSRKPPRDQEDGA